MTGQLVTCVGCFVVGVLLIWFVVWARRGRTPRALAWFDAEGFSIGREERFVVLGAPGIVGMLWCFAFMIMPGVGERPAVVAFYLMIASCVPVWISIMLFIPLPDFLYPRWARPIRRRNREQVKGIRNRRKRRRSRRR